MTRKGLRESSCPGLTLVGWRSQQHVGQPESQQGGNTLQEALEVSFPFITQVKELPSCASSALTMLLGFTSLKSTVGTGGVYAASSCLAAGGDELDTCTKTLKSSWFGQVRYGLLLRSCTFSSLRSSFPTAGSQNWTHSSGLPLTNGLKNSTENSLFQWKCLTTYCTVTLHWWFYSLAIAVAPTSRPSIPLQVLLLVPSEKSPHSPHPICHSNLVIFGSSLSQPDFLSHFCVLYSQSNLLVTIHHSYFPITSIFFFLMETSYWNPLFTISTQNSPCVLPSVGSLKFRQMRSVIRKIPIIHAICSLLKKNLCIYHFSLFSSYLHACKYLSPQNVF